MQGVTPNKAMKARHDKIRETGCVCCHLDGLSSPPPQIHHIAGCKTQEAHAKTLGLCYMHHMADQQQPPNPAYTSRHPNKKAFENRYGTEAELLIKQNELLA